MVYGLGERLAEMRNNIGLSQKEVAAAIGVSPSVISNYEASERTPSAERLLALSNLYHCSIDYLMGIEKRQHRFLECSMLTDRQYILLQSFLRELEGR